MERLLVGSYTVAYFRPARATEPEGWYWRDIDSILFIRLPARTEAHARRMMLLGLPPAVLDGERCVLWETVDG